jgi:hypothetical protein
MLASAERKHMSKYLVLYQSEGAMDGPSVSEMFSKATPEQLEAGMGAWRAWYAKCGSAVVDLGTPLDKAAKVQGKSSSDVRTTVTGYTILQAGSREDAVASVQDHPHLRMPGT